MPSSQIERKLAAIMFTDIAGYTAQMSKDENKALDLLDTQKQILTPIIEEFNGTLHKEVGDGLLFTFPTVTEAVKCGIKIQEGTKANDDLNLRIGIHEGEITLKDGDALGDDVNVASRIEAFSPKGGIAISSKVQQNISSLPEFETLYVGNPELKGVAQKVEIYCITSHGLPKRGRIRNYTLEIDTKSDNFNIFALTGGILTAIGVAFWIAVGVFDVSFGGKTEVPSVGILMMENRGGEENEFWASGITQDLIVRVAGAGLIRVAPMKEILEIDKKKSFEEIAKQLRVKYLLTSSIYKKEDGFDLHCQLIEAKSGNSKYANKWSESFDNAPTIVGNLADNILKTLKVSTKQEIARAPTTNVEAYEYYLRAKNKFYKMQNKADSEIVKGLLHKAIKLDDNLLEAKDMLGMYQNNDERMETYTQNLNQAERMDDKNMMGRSLVSIGSIYWVRGDYEQAMEFFTRSLDIYEKLVDKDGVGSSLLMIGTVYLHSGNCDKALDFFIQSLAVRKEIDKKTSMAVSLDMIGHCYRCKGIYDKALAYYTDSFEIREGLGEKIALDWSFRNLGLIYKDKGYYKKALEYQEKSLNIRKDFADTTGVRFLENTANLYFLYNKLGKEYDEKEIHILIKGTENIEFELNYTLYQLLEDTSFLESAYNQIQELADNLEPDVKLKFLSYPIPAAIVEEWEKVN